MGLSKTSRILILLTIDALFFLLEITVGQCIHNRKGAELTVC